MAYTPCMNGTSAAAWIDALAMRPHPEGGWYAETWRAEAAGGAEVVGAGTVGTEGGRRAPGSAIYYLLEAGQVSRWHRIDADELWHHYAGAPLELLHFAGPGPTGGAAAPVEEDLHRLLLGTDLGGGERPQRRIPAGHWQRAITRGEFSLVGCTVSPAFMFERFELAPPGWGL